MTSIPWQRVGRVAACVLGGLWFVTGQVVAYRTIPLIDAQMYWGVNLTSPYEGFSWGGQWAFSYAPPIALLFGLLQAIPWSVFATLWTILNVAILVWLLRGRPWVALALAQPIADSLLTGQIELLMTAAIVWGFRYPSSWAVPILTKIGPGIGIVWFVVRREWRAFSVACGVTLAVGILSFLIVPRWWFDWSEFLTERTGGPSHGFYLRAPLAVVLIAWGARRNSRWTVPAAACLALPVVYMHSLVLLAGVSHLLSHREPVPHAAPEPSGHNQAPVRRGLTPHGDLGLP